MESLRGTLVPRAAWTMKNRLATPSLGPQPMPRRAAGRRQMNSRSVPAAARPGPARREAAGAQSAPLLAWSAEEETWGQQDGLRRGEHQPSSESISGKYPGEGEVGGKVPALGEISIPPTTCSSAFTANFTWKHIAAFFLCFPLKKSQWQDLCPFSGRSYYGPFSKRVGERSWGYY